MIVFVLALLWAASGCEYFSPPQGPAGATRPAASPAPRAEPLPLQQVRAYPELTTGAFVTLANFEDAPGQQTGRRQVDATPASRRR